MEEIWQENPDTRVAWDRIVPLEVSTYIAKCGIPTVTNRFFKSRDHYHKALKLRNIDDEMGMMRLIGAHEELVVAIFELLKTKKKHVPEHSDFVKHFKSHVVKQAFYPTLNIFFESLEHMLNNGAMIDLAPGYQLNIHFEARFIENRVTLVVDLGHGKTFNLNPLSTEITPLKHSDPSVIDSLFDDFKTRIKHHGYASIRDALMQQADYRNKLMYSTDNLIYSMNETFDDLVPIFQQSLQKLCWVLAVLIGNDSPHSNWGLVSQFISLYRKILREANLLRA